MAFDDINPAHYIRHRMAYEKSVMRRRLSGLLFAFLTIISAVIFWVTLTILPSVSSILQRQEQIMAAELQGVNKIPDISTKLQKLESQISLLTTESIDARVSALEKALTIGNVKPEDISSLLEVRKEVGVLKTYMFRDPKELVDLKELQSNYRGLHEQVSQAATKDMVRSEVGVLQTIITVSFTFFGLLFTVLFGSWWFIGRKPKSDSATKPVG
jgi:cell division protein FtsL